MMVFLVLVIGFLFLIKGADLFVTGASALGVKIKIPQIVIGLTVVAFGTSLPELIINIYGSIHGKSDIVLGNILGSNIFNILAILGLSAMIFPITAQKNTIWREIPFVILVSLIIYILSNDSILGESKSIITRGDGIILLVFMGYFLFYIYGLSKNSENEIEEINELGYRKIAVYSSVGILGLIFGGNMVVDSAVRIANMLNVSDKIIAITIISIGTGLPEMVTSIVAAMKKNSSIALGNIVGSNIFNILLVIGISSIINPIKITSSEYFVDFGVMIISAMVLFVTMFSIKKATISRIEGFIMFTIYIIYIYYSIVK